MHRFDIEVEGSHNYFADGVMVHNSPETTPGGRALKFYSSVRLDIRRIESIKDGVEVVGNRTRVKVVKNKVAPPFKQAEFDIMYGKGISREGSLLDIGVDLGIVKKSGAWYTYEGEQLGQGRENAKQFLTENPEMMVEISEKVRKEVGIDPATGDPEIDGEIDVTRRRGVTRDRGRNGARSSSRGHRGGSPRCPRWRTSSARAGRNQRRSTRPWRCLLAQSPASIAGSRASASSTRSSVISPVSA